MNTKNTIQKVSDLINTQLRMKVQGFEDVEIFENDKATNKFNTRLQTLVINEDTGIETIKSIKLSKQIDGSKYLDKTIEAVNAKEYKIKFDTYYAADDIEIIKEDIEGNFEVNKSITLNITNISIVKPKDTKKPTNYAVYSSFRIANKLESIKIKVKNVSDEKVLKSLKGKKIIINNLNVMKIDMKTFYSIESLSDIS